MDSRNIAKTSYIGQVFRHFIYGHKCFLTVLPKKDKFFYHFGENLKQIGPWVQKYCKSQDKPILEVR